MNFVPIHNFTDSQQQITIVYKPTIDMNYVIMVLFNDNDLERTM